MESLDTSITLSENPIRSTNPPTLWVNNTSKYLYQNHQLQAKYLTASQDRFNKSKDLTRSRSIDNDSSLTPQSSSRSLKNSAHVTIALTFANKELSTFPTSILSHINSLLILDLSSNNFKEFPQEILSLTKLKSLKLESNRLKKIPKEIYLLSHIETLSLASNYITSIPNTISKLNKTLNVLNLSKNRIEVFPEEITQLTKLKVLWVQNNAFMTLPVQLNALTALRDFGLEWYKYTFPPQAPIQNDTNRTGILKFFELCSIFASSKKSEISFEDFIKHFSNINHDIIAIRDNLQRSLLHIASLEEEVGIVRYLAKNRPDLLNDSDQNNQTPLSLAIREEKLMSAKALVLAGANPNVGIGPLGSALHIATARHRVGLVKDLLKFDANPNETDVEGNTPLHVLFSIFSKNTLASTETAQMLMAAGADPNLLNYDGWSPLHLAIRRGQTECVRWSTDYNKKNEGSIRKSFDFNIKGGADKWTLLHLASGLGHFEILNILVDNKIDLMAKTKTGKTARDVAVNNVLIYKVLKKLEDQWINSNLFKHSTLDTKIREFSASSNVFNLKHMIHSSSTKALDTYQDEREPKPTEEDLQKKIPVTSMPKFRSTGVTSKHKGHTRPLKAHLRIDEVVKDLKIEESSIMIGDVDEVAEGKEITRVMPRSPNNIQKIQIAQNYREHMLRLSISKDSGWNGIVEQDPGKLKRCTNSGPISINSALSSKTSRAPSQHFIFPHDFNKFIKTFESYVEEIKSFQDLLLKESEVSLSEKLKHLFYMQVLHMKIVGKLKRINSENIPVELFVLCEHIEDEIRKGKDNFKKGGIKHNYDIIPRTLLFVFENLDSRKSLKNCFVKTRISHLFGDFKYDSSKHFLSLLATNPNERVWLRVEARLALGHMTKEVFKANLNLENIFKERQLASVLVSPKGFDTFNKEITPAHFSRTMQVHTSKPNKRTQSYIPPAKCENIEDEDDIHGFRHNNLRISLENNTLEKKGGAGYLRMNSGLRTVQGPLPSKSETLAKKHATSYSIQVTLGDQDYIGLDVRGMPKMMGVENYFSQK